MFRKCCVPMCNNLRQDVKLHKLPAAEDSKNRWLKCIGYENIGEIITTNMFVCHKHFEQRFVNPTTNRLKGDAYPSLFTDLEISSGHPSAVLTETDSKKTSDHSYSKKCHIDHSYAQPPNKMTCLEVKDTCTITSIDQEVAVSSSSSAIQDTCTIISMEQEVAVPSSRTAIQDTKALYSDGKPVSKTMKNTAAAVSFFEDLFDSVNGAGTNEKKSKGKFLRKAVTAKSAHHKFWDEAIKTLKAICEQCGHVGRRSQFYLRNNKVCSLSCHSRRRYSNWRFKFTEGTEHMEGLIPLEPLPQLQHWQTTFNDLQAGPIKTSSSVLANSYEWKDELFGCDFLAAPVSLFKHAPLHEMWDNTFEGMKVEVNNTDCENYSEKHSDFFWVATVLKVKGYMGLLRYEGFGSDDSKDFWVNLCCSQVHPVGWCATRGKPLIPPRSIEDKYTDWKKFLVKQLTGARTLPANFYTKLNDSLISRFSVGSVMEVVDKNRISQVKVASVVEIVGKRLHVKYYDSSPEDNGFWCHEDSPLIHPVGWAFRVGHPLDAPQTYCQRVAAGQPMPSDSTQEMFYKYPTNEPPLFSEGMKLEAIDPLNLSAVCAATVMQILNEGYMMIRIDCYPADASGADWFCYHQRSPCIFPVGFALANNIPLVPPAGWTAEQFSWERYLSEGGAAAAPRTSFGARGHVVSHGFVAGMRLECADLMDPRLVCVATVARVVADLLKVHFDGWGGEYDQWLWAHSTDVYPVGWCRAVGHRLEGPLQPARAPRRPAPRPPRRRRRNGKALRLGLCDMESETPPHAGNKIAAQPVNTTEESSQNSDMGDVKSLSPPTSVSEVSVEAESHNEDAKFEVKMDVDESVVEKVESIEEKDFKIEIPTIPTEMTTEAPSEMIEEKSELKSEDNKVIPRLVNTTVPLDVLNSVDPENWTEADVAKFLTVNDCQPYCVNFANITGSAMLHLTKDEIIELLEMKVGPSLKIFDLIQQLKCKIKQPQCRLLGSFK